MGAELYDRLSKYFVSHLRTVAAVRTSFLFHATSAHPLSPWQGADDLTDEALLRYYVAEWDRYTTGANFVHRLFAYLNRHWVRREKEEGKKDTHVVYTVSCAAASTSTQSEQGQQG